ncbi:MAG: hypothetical protein KatS3mg105_3035 [Gemmatales bacterium]|nr:MAG: hypothetical protein KatS3mg105_3035 [Gemmatales bacterium]
MESETTFGTLQPEPLWQPCPRGELVSLGKRLRQRRQRRRFLYTAAGTLSLLAAAGGAWLILQSQGEQPSPSEDYFFADLWCSEVQKLAKAFMNQELSPDMADKVRRHINACPRCGPLFAKHMAG